MGIVLLVRHGQASFGADDYDRLSDLGVEQSRVLGRAMAASPRRGEQSPAVVLSGGMRRHLATVDELAAAAGWDATAGTDPRWDEFDHLAVIDAYSGLRHDERTQLAAGTMDRRAFQELFEKATGRWVSANHDEDYAESFADFLARIRDVFADVCRAAGPRSTVAVVTSGGVIAAVAAMLVDVTNDPSRLSGPWRRLNTIMVNSSVTKVVVGSTGARLLTYNEHGHLPADQVTYR